MRRSVRVLFSWDISVISPLRWMTLSGCPSRSGEDDGEYQDGGEAQRELPADPDICKPVIHGSPNQDELSMRAGTQGGRCLRPPCRPGACELECQVRDGCPRACAAASDQRACERPREDRPLSARAGLPVRDGAGRVLQQPLSMPCRIGQSGRSSPWQWSTSSCRCRAGRPARRSCGSARRYARRPGLTSALARWRSCHSASSCRPPRGEAQITSATDEGQLVQVALVVA